MSHLTADERIALAVFAPTTPAACAASPPPAGGDFQRGCRLLHMRIGVHRRSSAVTEDF
jgi:hypothetical protein